MFVSDELIYLFKLLSTTLFLVAASTSPLIAVQKASLTEFLDRNPECSPSDVESAQSLIRSCFKKTESFRLVLLAMAASFFICRLC